LIIVDVGSVIELYADFSRQGKNYAQFPDRNSFRIGMADLRLAEVRERLKAVWQNPCSLDPAKRAAEVTQDIAALLAEMTKTMERRAPADDPITKGEWAFKVSTFLMRCIFAMFAEDIGLLPKGAFLKLIEQHKGKANRFHFAATDFFKTMDKGGYSLAIQQDIKKFNGGLFHEAISVEITGDELTLLEKAARRDWHAVEPAIFGTLLEQALTDRERSKLGAHYTPRSYVERLVVPTIIEPLRKIGTSLNLNRLASCSMVTKKARARRSRSFTTSSATREFWIPPVAPAIFSMYLWN
jgi:restriction-modification enzyme MmeI-like protein